MLRAFRVRSRLEAFYTGGPAKLAVVDGRLVVACACADEVRLLDVANGVVLKTFNGVRAAIMLPARILALQASCFTLQRTMSAETLRHIKRA